MGTTAFNSISKAVSTEVYKTKRSSCVLGLTSVSAGGQISQVLTLADSTQRGGSKGGLPVVSTVFGKVKALSGGTFAYGPADRKYIMKGSNVTSTISGVANTVLKSGAADFFRRPIAYKTGDRITFLDTLQWVSNTITGCTYTFTRNNTLTAYGNDTAAMLTRTSRGSVFYMVKGTIATETSWPSITLW